MERKAQSETTRDRLLEAGRSLFTEKGFQGTSTRAIAARAQCNVSLIKYYFGSKEGLLREVMRPYLEGAGEHLDLAMTNTSTPEETLRAVMKVVLTEVDTNRDNLRLVFRDLLTPSSPLIDELKPLFLANQKRIVTLLSRLKEAGVIRDVDPVVAGMSMAGMILFYYLAYPLTSHIIGERSPEVLQRLHETLPEIFVKGILSLQETPADPVDPPGDVPPDEPSIEEVP